MKRLPLIFLFILALVFNSTFILSKASAGELKTLGVTITWSGTFYEVPTSSSMSQYQFDFTVPANVLKGDVTIMNAYGERLDVSSGTFYGTKGANSGSVFVKILNPVKPLDWTGTKVCLEVTLSGGAGNSIMCQPIEFVKRGTTNSPAPTPTVTVTAKPSPAPTVTVTAIPAPAPTVYVTNPADATLADSVKSLKSQLSMLNSKLKKICAAKPKPKGC
jgi:hypothetical protein